MKLIYELIQIGKEDLFLNIVGDSGSFCKAKLNWFTTYIQSSVQSWTLNGLKTYHVNGKKKCRKTAL